MRDSSLKRTAGMLILLAAAVSAPWVITSPYYIHLFIMAGMNAVLAMTFVMLLRAGLISLANASFWGIGAYASTLLVVKLHLSFWLALPAASLITGIVAFFVGFLLVRNTGFAFLILTAVLGMVTVLVFGNIPGLGGYQGIEGIPPPDPVRTLFLGEIAFTKITFYYLMLFLLLIAVLVFSAFYASWLGRAWMAIGLKPELAQSLGINLFRYRLLAFTASSAMAGLLGSFYAHYIGAIIPNAFDLFKTIHIHIYAILGGLGSAFLGPVVGSLMMTFVPEFLRVTEEVEPIFTGLLLIVLILFLPHGILSLLKRRNASRSQGNDVIGAGSRIYSSLSMKMGQHGRNGAPSQKGE